MNSRTLLRSVSLVLILGVALVGACTKPSPSSTATSGSDLPKSAAPAATPDAPVNDAAQNAVGRAKAFVGGARRRDTNAMAAAVSFPFTFHDPAGELHTELLLRDAAPIVAPEMPAAAPGRTPVVTHLYGNGFTGQWTVQVDGAGVRS